MKKKKRLIPFPDRYSWYDAPLLPPSSCGCQQLIPSGIVQGRVLKKKDSLIRHSGLFFSSAPIVLQCPGSRADIGASPAEIALGFPVVKFCLIDRAVPLTTFTVDTCVRPLQGKEAYAGSKRKEQTVRADDTALGGENIPEIMAVRQIQQDTGSPE